MGSLDDGVKTDAENNIMKIFLIRSLHRTLFGLSSCGCFVWRRIEAKRELRNAFRIVFKPVRNGNYSDYTKKTRAGHVARKTGVRNGCKIFPENPKDRSVDRIMILK